MSKVRSLIEGLAILEKYGARECDAQHDCLYAFPDKALLPISEEDKGRLWKLGWVRVRDEWHCACEWDCDCGDKVAKDAKPEGEESAPHLPTCTSWAIFT